MANTSLTGQDLLDSKKKETLCFLIPTGQQKCLSSGWLARACDDKLLPVLNEHGFTRESHYRSHGIARIINEDLLIVSHTYSDGDRTIQLSTRLYLDENGVRERIAQHISQSVKSIADSHVQSLIDQLKDGELLDFDQAQKQSAAIIEEESIKERAQMLKHFENEVRCSTTYDIILENENAEYSLPADN